MSTYLGAAASGGAPSRGSAEGEQHHDCRRSAIRPTSAHRQQTAGRHTADSRTAQTTRARQPVGQPDSIHGMAGRRRQKPRVHRRGTVERETSTQTDRGGGQRTDGDTGQQTGARQSSSGLGGTPDCSADRTCPRRPAGQTPVDETVARVRRGSFRPCGRYCAARAP